MDTQTLNATLDCIKETTTFSERIITNVCTGQVTTLPIGFWEMLVFGTVGFLFLGIAVMITFMVFSMITNSY